MKIQHDPYLQALSLIDAANAQDPVLETVDGQPRPRELVYGERMSEWLERLRPDAPEALRLACRAQHIRRWAIPRDSYPMDRAGYKRWRADLGRFHADTAAGLLAQAGYGQATIERVRSLLRKENLKRDPDAQTLEDVACLVFLRYYAEDFAARYDDDKMLGILRKTWNKMSPQGHAMALKLPLGGRLGDLVARAVAPMARTPEPELMLDPEQARAYAHADFAAPNGQFLDLFAQHFPGFSAGAALDLGCGPGDICLRFARRYPQARVTGVDGSPAMLAFAHEALAQAPELQCRVAFLEQLLPSPELPRQHFDAVLSNSLLHHLHDPSVLWRTVAESGRPGAAVAVMDLFRPGSERRAREIVETYSGAEPEVLKQDFYNSLLAAFSVEEVREQLRAAGLEGLEARAVSDRHLGVFGRLPG